MCIRDRSNYVVYIRPCRDQHNEPMKNMSQRMYDSNPEHYGDAKLHPEGDEIFGGISPLYEVSESLLSELFNLGEDDD